MEKCVEHLNGKCTLSEDVVEYAWGEKGSEHCLGNTGLTSHLSHLLLLKQTFAEHSLWSKCLKLFGGGLLGPPSHLSLAMGQQSFSLSAWLKSWYCLNTLEYLLVRGEHSVYICPKGSGLFLLLAWSVRHQSRYINHWVYLGNQTPPPSSWVKSSKTSFPLCILPLSPLPSSFPPSLLICSYFRLPSSIPSCNFPVAILLSIFTLLFSCYICLCLSQIIYNEYVLLLVQKGTRNNLESVCRGETTSNIVGQYCTYNVVFCFNICSFL